MDFYRANLDTCDQARGTVVVIDVIRAFSTAAYAFAAGAESITLVGSVSEAFALREQIPGSLIMGEVGGLPVEGFDLSNSSKFSIADLDACTQVDRFQFAMPVRKAAGRLVMHAESV